MFTVICKVLPFSIAAAMLVTLISMTFSPVYFLSASFPKEVFTAKMLSANALNVAEQNLFLPRITGFNLKQTTRLIRMVDAEHRIEKQQVKQLQAELNQLLLSRINAEQTSDTLTLNLRVKKSVAWPNEYRAFLAKGLEFAADFNKKEIAGYVTWKTDYLKPLYVFLTALFVACGFTYGLFVLKGKT
ncbi:hypothetical protein [Alteromonas lipolytica]|uniref:Polysaccharide chain length determinant N-terminal domain-containing protein n=1 Tax=Alteromonas lipolytica TaxID=1856405 RepID=A0A1E8FFT1_9ALTE|nr:hypothetical protein [Alteromonas lipolytica]OFI34774.1 hypothetical protein BFC17_14435 [Alteromonas lipolytica]GGF53893.1 hypothetical protein GCM10011338_02550 [Alteromonas lipolytica]